MTAQQTPPRTLARLDKPLTGRQAQIAAGVQGHVWLGLAETSAIVDRAETAERIDERGDAEQRLLLTSLTRIATRAKARGEHETHAELQAEIARVRLVIELDGYEDDHRLAMADGAIEVNGALHRANGGVGVLLGQGEAVCDDLPLHPLSLCSIGGTDA